MNGIIAGLCCLGLAAFCLSLLRDQIRDGEAGITLSGINPIKVRRGEHALLFWLSVIGQIALAAILLIGSLAIIVQSLSA